MRRVKIPILAVTAFVVVSNLFAQGSRESTVNAPPAWVQAVQDARQTQNDRLERMNRELSELGRSRRRIYRRDPVEAEEEREILEDTKQKLAVPPSYYNRFAEFLKSKKYGIARLFPDIGCGQGLTVSVEELERCANVPQIKGGGSQFSFRSGAVINYLPLMELSFYTARTDIHFVENKFLVGNDTVQDIISNVGEVNLDELNPESDSLKFLVDFKPGKTVSEFKSQKSVLDSGINENGYLYSTSAQVKLNDTCILRSIAYYKKRREYPWNKDLLIAFKFVGQEPDGSIVILWRYLKEKDGILFKDR